LNTTQNCVPGFRVASSGAGLAKPSSLTPK
jgi:hypothetical protein